VFDCAGGQASRKVGCSLSRRCCEVWVHDRSADSGHRRRAQGGIRFIPGVNAGQSYTARTLRGAMEKMLGMNYDFGAQLHSALMRAGFGSPTVRFVQPVHMRGLGKGLVAPDV